MIHRLHPPYHIKIFSRRDRDKAERQGYVIRDGRIVGKHDGHGYIRYCKSS
ncbi:hypothetical protein ES703_81124 [subsurface metagenome]